MCIYIYVCLWVFMGVHPIHRELSRIRDHDAFVSQQAERAHLQLAGALEQTHTNSESVPRRSELNYCSVSQGHIFVKLMHSKIHQREHYEAYLSGRYFKQNVLMP